jgi:hypothetical protein
MRACDISSMLSYTSAGKVGLHDVVVARQVRPVLQAKELPQITVVQQAPPYLALPR